MPINQIATSNTFGEWVSATSSLITQVNNLTDSSFVSNGSITLTRPGFSLNVSNNAVINVLSSNTITTRTLNVTGNSTFVNANVTSTLTVKDLIVSGSYSLGALSYNNIDASGYVNAASYLRSGTYLSVGTFINQSGANNTLAGQTAFINTTTAFTTIGDVYLGRNAFVTANLSTTGNLIVSRDAIVTGNISTSGNLIVSRDASITGNISTSGNLIVSRDSTLSGNLSVTKDASITGNLSVTRNVTVSGILAVTGNTNISGNLSISKDLSILGNITSNLSITGNLSVSRDITVGNTQVTSSTISSGGFIKSPYRIVAPFSNLNRPSGNLTVLGTTSYPSAPLEMIIDSTGNFAYITNNSANTVGQYTISQTTGSLNSIGTIATQIYPMGGVSDPTGRFFYICNRDSSSISQYSINQSTGALTLIGHLSSGITSPQFIAADPTGRFVYAIGSSVAQYSINQSTGALTLIGTISAGGGTGTRIVVDPTGRFVYVSISSGTIYQYSINQSTGALTNINSLSVGSTATSMTLESTGRFVYVLDGTNNLIYQLNINQSTGSLTSIGSISTVNSFYSIVSGIMGRFVFVSSLGSSIIRTYSINQVTGSLSVYGTDYATGTNPNSIAIDPAGKFIYTTNPTDLSISRYAIGSMSVGNIEIGGNAGIGAQPSSTVSLSVGKNITNGTVAYGIVSDGRVQSDVTQTAAAFLSNISSDGSPTALTHFYASQGPSFTGTPGTQYGFLAGGTALTAGNNNYCFYASNQSAITAGKTAISFYSAQNISAGGSTYAFYASGTAPNYFNGVVGIGRAPATGYACYIAGENALSTSYALRVNNDTTTLFWCRNDGTLNTGVTTNSPYNNVLTGTIKTLSVNNSGELGQATSSLRYKDNIQDSPYGLNEVLKLRSVTFTYKNSDSPRYVGFIAEEVDAIGIKEFVYYNDEQQPESLNYELMVSMLAKAIQEQQVMIQDLKNEVANLKKQIITP